MRIRPFLRSSMSWRHSSDPSTAFDFRVAFLKSALKGRLKKTPNNTTKKFLPEQNTFCNTLFSLWGEMQNKGALKIWKISDISVNALLTSNYIEDLRICIMNQGSNAAMTLYFRPYQFTETSISNIHTS